MPALQTLFFSQVSCSAEKVIDSKGSCWCSSHTTGSWRTSQPSATLHQAREAQIRTDPATSVSHLLFPLGYSRRIETTKVHPPRIAPCSLHCNHIFSKQRVVTFHNSNSLVHFPRRSRRKGNKWMDRVSFNERNQIMQWFYSRNLMPRKKFDNNLLSVQQRIHKKWRTSLAF